MSVHWSAATGALVVPLINRGLTGYKPILKQIFRSRIRFKKDFACLCFWNNNSRDVSSMPWGERGTLVSWANISVGTRLCPTPLAPPCVRPDPPVVCPVLNCSGYVQETKTKLLDFDRALRTYRSYLSSPKPENITVV